MYKANSGQGYRNLGAILVTWQRFESKVFSNRHCFYTYRCTQEAFGILKSSSSTIRIVRGTSEMFQASASDEDGRMYLMKKSYYKSNTQGRLDMLQAIGAKLAPYSFYTERMVTTNEAAGLINQAK